MSLLFRRHYAKKEKAKETKKQPKDTQKKEKETVEKPSLNLNEFTVKELKELAKDKGLTGYSNLKKDELIKLLGGE